MLSGLHSRADGLGPVQTWCDGLSSFHPGPSDKEWVEVLLLKSAISSFMVLLMFNGSYCTPPGLQVGDLGPVVSPGVRGGLTLTLTLLV